MQKRLTGTTWQKIRQRLLRDEPLCRQCLLEGRIREATEIDHIIPLFKSGTNSDSNLQPLCTDCHRKKSIEERGKHYKAQIGLDGWPE